MKKNIYPMFIIIATFIMGIGYATVNSVILGIYGSIHSTPHEGIIITSANYDSSITADYENSEVIYAYQNTLKSKVILS